MSEQFVSLLSGRRSNVDLKKIAADEKLFSSLKMHGTRYMQATLTAKDSQHKYFN